nr:peptidase [Pantoea ananatis]
MTGVLLCLCLILLLTGCVRTETRYVQVSPVAIPSELTADCPVPRVPNPLTWGGSLELNEHLLTAIENCNSDKAAIREIEASRQGKTQFSQVLEQKMKKASI